jgi:hypothetical protein
MCPIVKLSNPSALPIRNCEFELFLLRNCGIGILAIVNYAKLPIQAMAMSNFIIKVSNIEILKKIISH